MSTFDATDQYFSGQGVVMIGLRTTAGKPKGLVPIGNVSSLKLSVATTVLEHKESHTGARATDLRLTTDIKATLAMVMESYNPTNLATALRGSKTVYKGTNVVGEGVVGYAGKVWALNHISVSLLTVKRGSQALTVYTNDTTPYDYKVNTDAGSIQFNDGSVVKTDKLTFGGTVPSAVTVGNPTVVTVANTAAVGDYAIFTGFSGADAALLNGIPFKITVASGSSVSIDVDTTGKTITVGTPLSFFDGQALTADYTWATQTLVDSLTAPATDFWVRFEGLNTADGSGVYKPVIVDVFRFSSDPLKELSLISDGIQQFTLDGSVLADTLQSSGSKYFRVTMLGV